MNEIPDGARRVVSVAGRLIGVFNIAGEFFALRNVCPHQGGPLCEGDVYSSLDSSEPGVYEYNDSRKFLQCPWHGWEFDLKTGQSWFDPKRTRVRPYPVRVEREIDATRPETRSSSMTKGPYRAEAFPATVEREFIVVEVAE